MVLLIIGDMMEEIKALNLIEMELFSLLLKNRGNIVSQDSIRQFLDSNSKNGDNYIYYINKLRKKLLQSGFSHIIVTKRGVGYIIL